MHVHILGIGGTFMGGIAAIARAAGHRVTGSDRNVYPPMSTQLEKLGIELTEGGRSLGLWYGGSRDAKDVSYSADAKGAMGARYVDRSTGYVTVVNVNME